MPDDPDRPRWHFMPPTGWMNEPHGVLHHGGRHHMFYQRNERGPFWGDISWGHAASDNLVDWVDLGSALVPGDVAIAPEGIWSGSSTVDADGEPVIFFTAGDNRDSPNQRTAVARAVDSRDPELREWTPSTHPVTFIHDAQDALTREGRRLLTNEFRDPYVWREDDRWFQLVGGGIESEGGTALLYEAPGPSGPWRYRGPLYVGDSRSLPETGVMWELPSLVPVGRGGSRRHALLVTPWWPSPTEHSLQHQWYWLGRWDPDSGTFVADDSTPRDLDFGGYFTGATPSFHPDGRTLVWSISQDLRSEADHHRAGWAGHAGVPLEVDLSCDRLVPSPVAELAALRGEPQTLAFESGSVTIDVGPMWDLELDVKIEAGAEVGVAVRLDDQGGAAARVSVVRSAEGVASVIVEGPAERGVRRLDLDHAEGALMRLRILADHSALEVFIDGGGMFTTRAWSRGSDAVRIKATEGAHVAHSVVHPLRAARMTSGRRGPRRSGSA
ncbi:glycoside hydrolase family 32 protein [Microbacterium sp. MC2]